MKVFICNGEFYCEQCAVYAISQMRAGLSQELTAVELAKFESAISEDWFDSRKEAPHDIPEHCASGEDCVNVIDHNGHLLGCWLETPLTQEGVDLVKSLIRKREGIEWSLWQELYRDQLEPQNRIGLKIFNGETFSEKS